MPSKSFNMINNKATARPGKDITLNISHYISLIFYFFIFMLIALEIKAGAEEFSWQRPVEKGINYTHVKRNTPTGPLHVHVLVIDLKNKNIGIRPELANRKLGYLEKTSSIALKSDAIAAINGSFFITKKDLNLPVGNLIINKKPLSRSILNRSAVGFTDDKNIIFGMPKIKGYAVNLKNRKSITIWGINRPRKNNETVVYTDEFGDTTRTNMWGKEIVVDKNNKVIKKGIGNSAIPKDGFVISLHGWSRDFYDNVRVGNIIELNYMLINGWQDVTHAITGGPLLIEDGRIVVEKSLAKEKFSGHMLPPNSRTAIGVSSDNKLILAVVDKRNGISRGMTYTELAKIMKDLGATYAMGLDGGGTSTMYLAGHVVNYPLDFSERPVSNALLITYKGWSLSKAFSERKLFSSSTSRLTEDAFKKILMENAELASPSYVQRPEDYGMFGLIDIYNKVIKPVIPKVYLENNN